MLFNSIEFIFLFLPIVFLGYFYLTKKRFITGAHCWLVVSSLFFYSWWNPVYLPLILLSMAVNYGVGSKLAKVVEHKQGISNNKISRKKLLIVGIVFNLSLLGYFKYADFFIQNLNLVISSSLPLQHIILPLAISFYTFQQIAYLVDSYKKETKEYDLLNYMLFVTFFPQLIAGPIVHHKEIMPQFASKWNYAKRYRNIVTGLMLFSIGLFKKVAIADTFAVWANHGFDGNDVLGFFDAWATSLSYTFQLYFDFSGYTDMAMGAALLFNIRLPINFNSPYKSLSIREFWRRWHITLGRFLRDYVYIPLGGNRNGEQFMYANLFITFLLGGLWHGASWMFVIWGVMHGVALIIHRIWQRFGMKMHSWIAWFLTFNFVNLSWVFFRATSLEDAGRVIQGMMNINSITNWPLNNIPTYKIAWAGSFFDQMSIYIPMGLAANILSYLAIFIAFIVLTQRNSYTIAFGTITNTKVAGCALLFSSGIYLSLMSTTEVFLYFNF